MSPRIAAVLVVSLLCHAAQVHAQTLTLDRDLIQDRQQRLLEDQQRRLELLQQLPGEQLDAVAPDPDSSDQCFDLREIRLAGATLMTSLQQQALLADFPGQCLAVDQLNEILKRITGFYLDRGYVTSRAYLPEQDLSDGVLEILVIEGVLEGMENSALASERELAMAFPGRTGERLNLRELEQLVDQIARLPSRSVQLDLVPGNEVGASLVRLDGQRGKPWRAGVARHNDGQTSTGEQQWNFSLAWDSPLGLGDQLQLRGAVDAVSDRWRHSAQQGLSYGVPWGWWTFGYHYNQSYYRTRTQAVGFSFTSDGESKRHQLNAERVVHRDALSRSAVSFGLAHLRTRNYIESVLLEGSSHRLSEFQLGLNHGRRIGSSFVNLDAGWQRGTGHFDAQSDSGRQVGQPVARYDKYTLAVSYLQPFQFAGQAFSVDSLLYGQRSEDLLFGPQRISIGGLASVRGFKEQSVTGDSGLYWRSNLHWRYPTRMLAPVFDEMRMTLGYDLGQIRGSQHDPGQSGRMTSNSAALSLQGRHLAVSLTFAQSLERPGALTRNEHPVYFRLDAFF